MTSLFASQTRLAFAFFILFALATTACTHTQSPPLNTAANSQNQAIAPTVDWPEPALDGHHQPAITVKSGTTENDIVWTQAKAYVNAPLLAVLEACQDPAVIAAQSLDPEIKQENIETEVNGEIRQFDLWMKFKAALFITVDYTMRWTFKKTSSDAYLITANKIAGTSYITSIQYIIRLHRIDEQTTGLEMRTETIAAQNREAQSQQYVEGLYQRISQKLQNTTK